MTSQITTFEEMQARLSKLEEQVRQMEKVVEARALHICQRQRHDVWVV